jgi:HEAT repeat protein
VHTFVQWLGRQDLDFYIRSRIAQVLGMMGDRSIVSNLLALLKKQEEAYERSTSEITVLIQIVRTIGVLAEPTIAPTLLELLQNQQLDVSLRSQIAQVLGTLNDEEVIAKLEYFLQHAHLDTYVRFSIMYALALQGRLSISAQDLLLLLRQHASEPGLIVQILGALGDRSIAPALLELLQDTDLDLEPYVRSQIVQVLGILGEPAVVPGLLSLLAQQHQKDKLVRSSAALVLRHFTKSITPDEIIQLTQLLDSSDVASDIHRTLWIISRQRRIRIYWMNEQSQKDVHIEDKK